MRARVLAVNWHDQQPVYSLDFLDTHTLVTAGGDKEIRVSDAELLSQASQRAS